MHFYACLLFARPIIYRYGKVIMQVCLFSLIEQHSFSQTFARNMVKSLTYDMDTQKNRLSETVLLCIHVISV